MTSRNRVLVAALLAPLLTLTACSGEGGKGDGDPADVLGAAKTALDETSGVHLVLAADELPDDLPGGVVKAEGDATHAPAFKGDIVGRFSGIEATIKVIAVDGVVYAILPFSSKYTELNPEDYGAPDPAGLVDPSSGISAWLTATTDVEKGDQTRDGGDVLTTYSGTLPGQNVVAALPTADETGTFEASYAIDDEGLLRSATITGPFYKGSPDVTYQLALSDYGSSPDISAP